eukprot:s1577_g2.t1
MALAPPEAAASGSLSSSGTLGKTSKGECVKVVVRVRPLSSQERTDGREVIVRMDCGWVPDFMVSWRMHGEPWSPRHSNNSAPRARRPMAFLCSLRGSALQPSWVLAVVEAPARPPRMADVGKALGPSCCGAIAGALTAWRRRPNCRSASTQTAREAEAKQSPDDPLAVFVVLRKDLDWPTGALINQACHACTAMAWEARDDDQAVAYLSQGVQGTMVKSTMGAKSQADLEDATKRLTEAGIPYKLWVEQPEDVPVCVATWPRPRSVLRKVLKKLSRF